MHYWMPFFLFMWEWNRPLSFKSTGKVRPVYEVFERPQKSSVVCTCRKRELAVIFMGVSGMDEQQETP